MLTRSLFMAAGVCLFAVPVQADATSAARKAIQADFAQMDAAQRRKDFLAPLAFNAPGYVATTLTGNKLTTKDYREAIPVLQARTKSITMQKVKTTITSFTLQGNTATVTVSQETQISIPVNDHTQISRDVITRKTIWKKHGNQWLMERSFQLSDSPS
jgi:ketosteroid isomerase-like protein